MIILQADIKAFGKLKDKSLSLRPGMNVITGDNESGKTTLAAFLRGMLFGIPADSETYNRFLPQEFEGDFGGALKILSDGAFYRIERSFLKEASELRIVKLSDGSVVEEPETWLLKAVGEVAEADYAGTGFIPQGALIKEIDAWGVSPEKAEEVRREAAIRTQYGKAKERLQKERADFMVHVDPELSDKMVRNASELQERETLKNELDARFGKADRDLKEMEAGLRKDSDRVREENDTVVRNMKDKIQNTKAELSKSVSVTEKHHKSGAVFGIIFMTLGLLLAAVSWFFLSSEKLEGIFEKALEFEELNPETMCAGGFAAAALFFLAGVICAIINSANRAKVKKHLAKQDGLREAATEAEKEYQNYLDNIDTMEVKVDHAEERGKRLAELQAEVDGIVAEQKENADRISELLENGAAFEKKSAEQEKTMKEVKAIDLALASFDKLAELPDAEAGTDATSLRATDFFKKIDGGKDIVLRIAPEGTIYAVTGNVEKPVTELSLGTAQEVLLATRLALFEEKDPGKKLPVILDDAFSGFDESRLNSAMNLLRSLGRQAVLLSCQTRERQNL